MCIVERYISRGVLSGYLFLFFVFLLLYIIIDLFSNLQDLIKGDISLDKLLFYYVVFLPRIFLRVSPVAFLISSLYCLGILNKNNELLSLRIQGLSIFRISLIFFIPALVLSMVNLSIETKLIPEISALSGVPILERNSNRKSQISNFAVYTQEGYFIFSRRFDIKQVKLFDVNIFKEDKEGRLSQIIFSPLLEYRQGRWFLRKAIISDIDFNNPFSGKESIFEERELDIREGPGELSRMSSIDWEDISLRELQRKIKKFSSPINNKFFCLLKVEFHRKIAENFSLFFLLLGALPFGLRIKPKRVGLSSLGLVVAVAGFYYLFLSLSLALGKNGFFPAWFSSWLPNIFFGISGSIGLVGLR